MRWSWLRAVILGLLVGPAPATAEVSDVESAEAEEPSSERPSGHVVCGLDFYVWDEDPREAKDWAVELAQPFGERRESMRWRGIAAASAVRPSILTDEIEAELARRSATFARESGISTLGCILCLLSTLDRTRLISTWATSSSEPDRRALARALSAPFDAIGVYSAIDHLQMDPNPEVRRLARAAAATRTTRPS
jgi:hypothetical protein